MSAHALLSPSGASRWLACPRSARLEQQFPDRAGQAAAEGTLAHELGELMIGFKLGRIKKPAYQKHLKTIQANELYDTAMYNFMEEYSAFVLEEFHNVQAHTPDADIFLETKLDMTDYVPEGFGTGDVCIVADHVLTFIDLKYGKGVPVDATENKQMMLYALGLIKEYAHLYDAHTIRMTIYQPRLDSISTWEIGVNELIIWAETVLKPTAKLAFEGKGEFTPGKHCQFCKAKAVCRANAEWNLDAAKNEFTNPDLLTKEEVAAVLDRSSSLKKWLTSVEDYALMEAIHNDVQWPGLKLVEGRSNRRYVDENAVVLRLCEAGVDEDKIYKPKSLVGITELQKNIGKPLFTQVIEPLLEKPPGAPTLVNEADPRPVYADPKSAASDFADDFTD
jgi:hypothetical protein